MAVVYRAEDVVLGRTVALKTPHSHYAEDPAFRLRFKQEARAMASLDHENIIKVYDISQDGEIPFIVAEYVQGRDIGDLLRRNGRFNEKFTKRVALQLLSALAYAHHNGIVHRDIKPSNILITPDGIVKVADFGIARLIEGDDIGEPGEIIGSARYMSPEQLTGRETTPQSDIYSVGVLVYHCLTGETPFNGDTMSIAYQQVHKPPPSPRLANPDISPRMEQIILRAMAKNPAQRYPTAAAMLDALQVPILEELLPPDKVTRPVSLHRRPRRGRILVSSILGVLLLLGGGTAAGLAIRDRQAPPESQKQNIPAATQSQAPPAQPPSQTATAPVTMVTIPNIDEYFDYWAKDALQKRGFQVNIKYEYRDGYSNRGVTWKTEPAWGTAAPKGSTVTVYATPKDQPQPKY